MAIRVDQGALSQLHPRPSPDRAYAALARAVLAQALSDWRDRPSDPLAYFLLDPRCAWFVWWCTVAGVNPEAIRERIRRD